MKVVLQYFESCPNWRVAETRLQRAMDLVGIHVQIVREPIETHENAIRASFRGSPTLLLDGRDLFADQAGPIGLSCRVYLTEHGPQGTPSVGQLVAALARELRRSEPLS